jgi:hypothetical protein
MRKSCSMIPCVLASFAGGATRPTAMREAAHPSRCAARIWPARAPPLPSLRGDTYGRGLKKELTCGARTSVSGEGEIEGVNKSFPMPS